MTYATAAQVALRLGNAQIGIVGSTLVSDTEIAEMLDEVDADINSELDVTTNVITGPYAKQLTQIEVDVVAMMILQVRHYREGNLLENASNYWQITPGFTNLHIGKLQRIRQRLQSQTFIGNTETGIVIKK
jgi:hypothetical protein